MPINIVDLVAGIIVVLILGTAIFYIIKAKKSGQKCIGCPMSKSCSAHCSCKDKKEDKNAENGK